jgi:hypothetical protein
MWSIFWRVLVRSLWSRRQWRVGYSVLTINMPLHYRFVEQFFDVFNIRVFKPRAELPLLLTGASRQY